VATALSQGAFHFRNKVKLMSNEKFARRLNASKLKPKPKKLFRRTSDFLRRRKSVKWMNSLCNRRE
jgi:hypothetical protein